MSYAEDIKITTWTTTNIWKSLNPAQKAMYCQGFFEGMFLIIGIDKHEGRRPWHEQLDYNLNTLQPSYLLALIERYYALNGYDPAKSPFWVIFNWQTGGN